VGPGTVTRLVNHRSSDGAHRRRFYGHTDGLESSFRLLIVADVRLYREGMRDVLARRPQFSAVATAGDEDEALGLIAELQPDVVIVDMATRHSLDVVRGIRRADPRTRVVGFGVQEVEGEILACAEAGLAGYVPCEASLDELVERTLRILGGELLCTPRMAAALFRRLELRESVSDSGGIGAILTAREREVLRLIDGGLSNKEIATNLNIEVSTVKNHVHNLLEKLQVSSRMQAAAQLGSHLTVRQRVLGLASQADLD
jgi:two-component system, NarL family, nitrate/nitrite response regulator NarL